MSSVDQTSADVIADGSTSDRFMRSATRTGLVIAIGVAVAIAMWPTTQTILAEWSDTENLTYTHGWMIAAVAVWCIVRRRDSLAELTLAPKLAVAMLLFLLSVVWLIVYQAGLLVVHQALLPLAMWLAVWAICGWSLARASAFGFGYLYFAIPIWSLLNSTLQSATTVAMKSLLPIVGVPTLFEGNTVYIPSGVFEIAGGCSGLHFFVVGVAIAALYGEIHRDNLKTRIRLVAVAAILSILANWIRVFTIIVAGHLTEMQHFLITVDHYYFGWVVFAVSMVLFFYWASRTPQNEVADVSGLEQRGSASRGRFLLGIILAMVAIGFGPMRAAQARMKSNSAPTVLPQLSGGWAGPFATTSDWQPKFSRADASILGIYRDRDQDIEVFVAHYSDQRQGKEMSGSGNTVLGETMRARSPRKPTVDGYGEREIEALDGSRWIVWDRYQVGSRAFYSPTFGQLWYGVTSVKAPLPSAVLAVRSKCAPDCDAARKANERFVGQSELTERLIP